MNLMIAIALWCEINRQTLFPLGEMQKCRDRLLECSTPSKFGIAGIAGIAKTELEIRQCFEKEKIK